MLSHKNRNKQMPVYSIQQHLELKKVVKLVKHVVSFIGKELAEDLLMTLTQTHHFCVRKSLLSITLICSIILISHIAQLFLIRKFYCFRKGWHIYLKYARHNHLRCPMMGEVSLES